MAPGHGKRPQGSWVLLKALPPACSLLHCSQDSFSPGFPVSAITPCPTCGSEVSPARHHGGCSPASCKDELKVAWPKPSSPKVWGCWVGATA